jgi:hypothetical protein
MTPPLIKGGQGRTPQQVRDSAQLLLGCLLIAAALILALVAIGAAR